jgi:hypothetical protein
MLWPFVLVIGFLPQGAGPTQTTDLAALATAARTGDDVAVRRAAAERFLNERTRPCAAPQGAPLDGWPAGKDVTLATEIFFAQPVDDEQEQELQRAVRDMMKDVLQPLGIRVAEGDGTGDAAMVFTGIAEALPAMRADTNVFGGTWWRGAISVHSSSTCVFSRAIESRVHPPPGPDAFLVNSPSDAPFLGGLDPALLEALVAVAEALRGQTGLARIASSDADARACLLALARISDQGLLGGLARTAKAAWVRIPAVGKLLDVNRLAAIARTDADADVRRAALARIAELQRKD